MPITSSLSPRYLIRRLVIAAIFVGVGVVAIRHGWFTYPAERTAYLEYQELLSLRSQQREAADLGGTLTPDARARLAELEDRAPESAPAERSELDILLQKVVWVPICFGVGFYLLATVLIERRRTWTLRDDGTLVTPEGEFSPDRITGISLARWADRSIAAVEIDGGSKGKGKTKGGRFIRLDAFIHDGVEDIVRSLDQRFHPEKYAPPPEETPGNAPAVGEQAETGSATAPADADEESARARGHAGGVDHAERDAAAPAPASGTSSGAGPEREGQRDDVTRPRPSSPTSET